MGIIIRNGTTTAECETAAQAAELFRLLEKPVFTGEASRSPAAAPTAAPVPPKVRTPRQAKAPPAPVSGRSAARSKRRSWRPFSANSNPDIKTIARKLYGADTSVEVNRLRVCINRLVAQGDLRELPNGGWKVV